MKPTSFKLGILAIAASMAVLAAPSMVRAADHDHHGQAVAPGKTEKKMDHLYGNHTCPISGEPVSPDSFVAYANKEKGVYARIYLCCQGCEKKVKKDLDKTYSKLYRTDPKTGKSLEAKDLKNEKCPNTGEPVDPKAKIEYNGMIVHFCCPECSEEFLKDPEAKMAKLLPKADEFRFEAMAGAQNMKMKAGK
jgi:YHS domain-containing protein